MVNKTEQSKMVKVGDGVTINFYSDCQAATVIGVSASGKTVKVQYDNQKLLNGADSGEPDALHFAPGGFVGHTSGAQRWECTRDTSGTVRTFTLRKRNGRYVQSGSTPNGTFLTLDGRYPHYDFNF